jgi:biopolymer transport protein ExbD
LSAALQFGCGEGQPSKILRLEITRGGQYMLEGQELTEPELREALAAAKQSGRPVELEIGVSPQADYGRVSAAVTVAQSQQIALIRFANQPNAAPSGASWPK